MSHDFNTNTDNNDEWLTPPYIIEALGPFDLDPCAPIVRPWDTAAKHYTVLDNGLMQRWEGRVWLNPPYGDETFRWMDRLSTHEGGGIALIFARTETAGFHRSIWNSAHSLFFFQRRIYFRRVDGSEADSANAPSCLVSYTKHDSSVISRAGLDGKQVFLQHEPKEEPQLCLI